MSAYLQCLRGIFVREWLRFFQQRSRFLSALVRPLLWLIVFASGFRAVRPEQGTGSSGGGSLRAGSAARALSDNQGALDVPVPRRGLAPVQ